MVRGVVGVAVGHLGVALFRQSQIVALQPTLLRKIRLVKNVNYNAKLTEFFILYRARCSTMLRYKGDI